MAAGAGICLGCLAWGFAASIGLGALLTASRVAFDTLRLSGACYLIFLGGKILLQNKLPVLQTTEPDSDLPGRAGWKEHSSQWFLRGLVTNLLNPKVGVFYVTFLPLFIPAGVNAGGFSMLLATIHAAEGMLWFAALVVATRSLSTWLRRPRVARTLNRTTGVVFVGAGVRLFLDRGR